MLSATEERRLDENSRKRELETYERMNKRRRGGGQLPRSGVYENKERERKKEEEEERKTREEDRSAA